MEGDHLILDTVVFDMKEMLMLLFNNPELNQSQNLVINAANKFKKYEAPYDRYGKISSGTWYNNAYANCIKNSETKFLCLLVHASDKTTFFKMENSMWMQPL